MVKLEYFAHSRVKQTHQTPTSRRCTPDSPHASLLGWGGGTPDPPTRPYLLQATSTLHLLATPQSPVYKTGGGACATRSSHDVLTGSERVDTVMIITEL